MTDKLFDDINWVIVHSLKAVQVKSGIIYLGINCLTPNSTESKTDEFSKVTNWGKLKTKHCSTVKTYCLTAFQSYLWGSVIAIESKDGKLCITQGFTLGVKGLPNSTTVKY